MTIVVCAVAVAYFLLSRRATDFYALAFFSCVIYFLPSLLGYVWHTRPIAGLYVDVFIPIDPRVQVAHAVILAILLAATVLHDRLRSNGGQAFPVVALEADARQATLLLAGLAIALYLAFLGQDLASALQGQKGQFGRLYALAAVALPFAFTQAATTGHARLAALFGVGTLVDLYFGNREPLVFAMLSTAVILLARAGPVRLIRRHRVIAAAVVGVVLVMAYKNVALQVRLGNWPLVISRLTSPAFYFDSVATSEPFVTQSILHYAVVSGWSYDGSFLAALVSSLVPFGNAIVGDPQTISGHINSTLFERVGYGVASNIWAEAYIYGRWPLLVVYAVVYATVPAVLNVALARWRLSQTRTCVSLLGVLLLFYVQRAGLDGTAAWVKRLLVLHALGCAVVMLAAAARARVAARR